MTKAFSTPSFISLLKTKEGSADFDAYARTRLSQNFILRDFLYSTDSEFRGVHNIPENKKLVIKAGKALCLKVLEPILKQYGNFAITFGYQSRAGIEGDWTADKRRLNPHSSSPHQWDRKTFGDEVYARVDILPYCVEDGIVTRLEFGRWLMHNLDIDLLMSWKRRNVFCITISPKPRRVWIEWGSPKNGEPLKEMLMGTDYWQNIYPTLLEHERPKYSPSFTSGSMQW